VRHPQWQTTRAVTSDAPPAAVWPWIVRTGFPGTRRLVHALLARPPSVAGARSADEIIPELQGSRVGDEAPDSADDSVYWTVEAIEPERHLVLRTNRHVIPSIRTVDSSWAVVLKPVGQHKTSLYLRARAIYTPAMDAAVRGDRPRPCRLAQRSLDADRHPQASREARERRNPIHRGGDRGGVVPGASA
jgi:hypothetical protein